MPTVEDFASDVRGVIDKLRKELGGITKEIKGPLLGLSKNAKKFSDVYDELAKSVKGTSDNLNQAINDTTETLIQKQGLLGIDYKVLNENIGKTQGLTAVLEDQLKNRKDLSKEERKAIKGQIDAAKGYIKQVTGFSSATRGLAASVKAQVIENFGPEEIIGQLDRIPIVGDFLKSVGLDLLRQRKARKDAAREAVADAERLKLQEERDNVKISEAKQKQAETLEEETENIKSGGWQDMTSDGGGIVTISDDSIQLMTEMLTIGFKEALQESQPSIDSSKMAEMKEDVKSIDLKKEKKEKKVSKELKDKKGGAGALGLGLAATGIAGAIGTLTATLTAAAAVSPAILLGGAAIGGGIGAIFAGIGIGAAVGGAAVSGAIYLIGEAIDSIASPLTNLKDAVKGFEELDGEKLSSVGLGLADLTGSLKDTAVAGIIARFAEPEVLGALADSVKKYENLDGNKLTEVGDALANLDLKDTAVAGIIARFAEPTVLGALAESVKKYEDLDPSKLGETADALTKFGPALSSFAGEGAMASFKGFVGGLLDFVTLGDDPVDKLKKMGEIADPLTSAADAMDKFTPAFEKLVKMVEGDEFEDVGKGFKNFSEYFGEGANNITKAFKGGFLGFGSGLEDIELESMNQVSQLIESVASLTRAQQIGNLSSENASLNRGAIAGSSQPMINNTVTTQNNSQGVVINRSVNNDNLDTRIVAYS